MTVSAPPLRIFSASRSSSLAAAALTAPAAEAHITRIVIDPARSESPTFEGRVFGPDGSVGPYEKLRGKAFGEVDPADPRNAVITDLKLAPRNARGKVEYSMDIFILKPIDLKKGNHKVFLDFNNRGEMRVAALNDAALSNNPTKAAHSGHGLHHEPGLFHRRQRVGLWRDERRRRHDHFGSGREEPRWIEHHRPVGTSTSSSTMPRACATG